MIGIDFDFARYVAVRRGQVEQRAREGAAYSFAGERRMRRALSSMRPVTMALEATTRLWKNVAKTELLGSSVKVTDQQFPRIYQAAHRAGEALNMRPPPIYAARAGGITCKALGTEDDAYVVVSARLAETLDDAELTAAMAHELAHIQNSHVLYGTALHYLTTSAIMFVRWVVQPAIMTLQAWSRRAEITSDRAMLLAARDLDVALATMVKLTLGIDRSTPFDVADYLKELPESKRGVGRYAELFRSNPYLPKRVQALRLFAESAYYGRHIGDVEGRTLGAEDLDKKVAAIVSVI
jgi:Zn-dependent protease with chaperone function